MAWFEDLSPCGYWGPKVFITPPTAVGWLEEDHIFTKGRAPSSTLFKLCDFLVDNWEPFELIYRGYHACSMCGLYGNYENAFGHKFTMGCRNLFIPSANNDFLFAAPSMIFHYMIEHDYLPPDSFIEAVDSCPPMGSLEYLQAIEPFFCKDPSLENIFLRSYGMAYARELGCQDEKACSKRWHEMDNEDNAEKRSKILKEAKELFQHDLEILESFAQSSQIRENIKAVRSIQVWIKSYQRQVEMLEEIVIEKEKKKR
jgi:hypothetical protein